MEAGANQTSDKKKGRGMEEKKETQMTGMYKIDGKNYHVREVSEDKFEIAIVTNSFSNRAYSPLSEEEKKKINEILNKAK